MRVPVTKTAGLGMIADTPPSELPLEAWSYTRNLEVRDGALIPAKGAPRALTLNEAPEFLLAAQSTTTRYLMACGATEAALYDGSSSFDITPTGGVAGSPNSWTGGFLGTIPVLCDGTNPPYAWIPQSPSSPLIALPNWPVDVTCGGLRSFQNYLIALDITKSGIRYPHLILWSHPADAGSVPATWDITDPTFDAGEYPLLDTQGFVVDGLAMRGSFSIFKEDSIYSMRFIGGQMIFRFDRLVSETGVFSKNCAANVGTKADQQVVWTRDNIILHNGTDSQGLLNGRLQRWLFQQIETSAQDKCFVCRVPLSKEIWFCYPQTGSSTPNMALVWNWEANTFGPREIPPSSCASVDQYSFSSGSGETWGTDTEVWAEDTTSWDQRLFSVTSPQCLLGGIDSYIYWVGAGDDWDWGTFSWTAERLSLPISADRTGKPIVDHTTVKLLTEVWPRISMPGSGTVTVEVGSQFSWTDIVTWNTAETFNPADTEKVNPIVSGRLLSIRFNGTTRTSSALYGYDLNIEGLSTY